MMWVMVSMLPPGDVYEIADGQWTAVADEKYGGHQPGPFATCGEAWDALLASCPAWHAEYERLSRELGYGDTAVE
jgi:hypothetical protein